MLALSLLLAAAPLAVPRLPLKSLVLYENGVGYFERKGPMVAGAVAEIPLEPGQLDDALKSMVVVSERGVASVEFAPPLSAEAARAMAGMPEPEGQRDLSSLLRALQGVEVKVARLEGQSARGRVVEVADEEERDLKGNPLQKPTLLLFGEAGLQRVRLEELASVRPVDPAVQLAWYRATGSASAQPERQSLKVRSASGGGSVAVGYTTEAPVWRTTYRLVLQSAAQQPGRLQGFALVHNDSDEAWEGVKVTLASGRPTSFLFPLAGPRYGRRELVSPEDGLDPAPQLATAEAREHLRGALGGTVGLGAIGTVGHGYGMGSGSGSIALHGSSAGGGGVTSGASDLLSGEGPTPLDPAAVSEAGELFLYTVTEPVFLGARKSALLPIIDRGVTAERVTVIAGSEARLAVRLSNSTPLTLEGGTVSVFTDGAYAGESQIDRIKPNEVRVVPHGEDLDLEQHRTLTTTEGPVKAVRKNGSVVELHRVDRKSWRLELTSRSEKKRTVLFELGSGAGYRVTAGAEEDVRSPGQPRYARLALAPKEKRTAEVVEEGAIVERVPVEQLTSSRLDALLARQLDALVRATLVALRSEAGRAEAAAERVRKIDARLHQLEGDSARLRDDLAAAGKGGAAKVAEDLGRRLLLLEDELGKLRLEREQAEKVVGAARSQALQLVSGQGERSRALPSQHDG
ncbi:MAG: hypothetical protein IPJ65_31705 [Archangiaceae bacterium]|nr:hypothetical protein [Archangiaceae bacterium]